MERLRCPICKSEIELTNSHYSCRQPSCQARFPVVDGVPILINESNSIFEIDKIVQYRGQSLRSPYFGSLDRTKQFLKKVLPTISVPDASMQLTMSALRPDLPGTLRAGGYCPS